MASKRHTITTLPAGYKPKQIKAGIPAGKPVIAMSGEVTIRAAEGDGKSGPPTFDVVAYTGQPMNVEGYDLPVLVDLSGMSFGKSLIANLDHDRTRRVGHVTGHRIESGQLSLSGVASAATPYRDEVIASAREGFVWQASIEAKPGTMSPIKAGAKVTANGREWEGPLYLVSASTLKGFAFVSHGADDDTTVTIAATAANTNEGNKMEPELRAWLEGMGTVIDAMTPDQITAARANFRGQQTPPPADTTKPASNSVTDILAARKAENTRQEQIAAITQTALIDYPHLVDEIAAMAENAITAKHTPQQYELDLLRATRPLGSNVNIICRGPERMTPAILEAAVCVAARLPDVDKKFKPELLEAADKRFPNGLGLCELLIVGAQANGHNVQGSRVTLDVQRAAFGQSQLPGMRASAMSTLSVPGILSNIANKFLVRGFMGVESVWRSIARIKSVRDFKTVTSYTLTGGFSYDKVGPSGELKHGTVGEETYTNQADTYGKMFAITRTDIINDDLGALTDVPMRLGRGAAVKLNSVFWTEFLDNSAFFASGNNNVSTGATSALGDAAGIKNAEVKFLNQTDPDGLPLGIMPAILLVPPTLKATALSAMNSQYLIATDYATSASTTAPSGNVFAGRFRVESSPYMENASFTGYSAAAWYLLADPQDMAVIEVCFLNGRDAPIVESADAQFNTLGVEMRGYHDFGVNLQEYRGGVRSAGS